MRLQKMGEPFGFHLGADGSGLPPADFSLHPLLRPGDRRQGDGRRQQPAEEQANDESRR